MKKISLIFFTTLNVFAFSASAATFEVFCPYQTAPGTYMTADAPADWATVTTPVPTTYVYFDKAVEPMLNPNQQVLHCHYSPNGDPGYYPGSVKIPSTRIMKFVQATECVPDQATTGKNKRRFICQKP